MKAITPILTFLKTSKMYSINKNSYLQSRVSTVNPRILNRCVDRAREFGILTDPFDFEPPFFRLTSEQPDIPIDNVDVSRRPVAFGNWALPKLRRELHHENETVVIEALTSLSDLVHDPEKGYEAIRLKIPDRLADLLLEPLAPVRERAVLVLSILAELADGKEAIVRNESLVENLKLCIGDSQPSVRLKTAVCIEMIARTWMAADVLVEHEFIEFLLDCLGHREMTEIQNFHLDTLKSLMYGCGKCIALKNNGFKIFLTLLEHDCESIVSKALDCLMILTSTKQGKRLALEKDLLKTLNKLLHYGNAEVCTSAASVIMFCTVKTKAKIAAAEIKTMPKRLIKLATNPLNVNLQMFCLKALTNICEHPDIRKEVGEKYSETLKNLQVGTNEEYKNVLLKIVYWVPEKLE